MHNTNITVHRSSVSLYGTAQRQIDTRGYSPHKLLAESTQFHQPVLVCTVRKTCQHFFAKGNNTAKRALQQVFKWVNTSPSVIRHIHM